MLDHAVSQAIRAQSALDTVTEVVRSDRGTSPRVVAATDQVAATTARLTAHVAAMNEISDQLRTIRRSWPVAN